MLELLSPTLHGCVFTLSSQEHAGLRSGNFRVFAGRIRETKLRNWLTTLKVQILLPIRIAMAEGRPSIIITYDPYGSGLSGLLLKLLLRAKLIVQIMGDYHRLDPNDELIGEYGRLRKTGGALKKAIMKVAFRTSVAAADAVKVLNKDQEDYVRHHWPTKPIFRFADFAATKYFSSLATYQGDYLLAVGFPYHRKGIDILLRAFARITNRFPNMRLKVLGYAPPLELQSYRDLIESDAKVDFLKAGWIEDVGEQMRGCYGLVHAARSEAMGRVLLEAMACRKPIVCTKTNGGLDYVIDGRTGILCEIDDVESLASAMSKLLQDPETAKRLGDAGYDHLLKSSSEERFSEQFISMAKQVSKASPRQ